MDDLLSYGVEDLGDMLKSNSNTKKAFQSIADVIDEISKVIEKEDKGMMGSLLREC